MSECAPRDLDEPRLIFSRFGNYIGEPEESEVEEDAADNVNQYMYDEEVEDENAPVNDQQLMEIDCEIFGNAAMRRC